MTWQTARCRIGAVGVQRRNRVGTTRTVFLERETFEMGHEVQMNMTFPERQGDGLGQTGRCFLNSRR